MDAGITVLAGPEVFKQHKIPENHFRAKVVQPDKGYKVGNFKIIAFSLFHDCPCLGFWINHPSMGNVLFITDTCLVENKFENINHVLLEVNYSDDILISNIVKGSIPALMKPRLMSTHMELESAKLFLRSIASPELQNIVLIHLSSGNSDEKRFITEITGEFGVNTIAGDKEITINLDIIPY